MSLSEKKNNEAPSGEPRTFQKVKARGEVERAQTWKRNCSAGGRTSYCTLFSSGSQTRGGAFSRWVAHVWIQSGVQARQGHGWEPARCSQNAVKIPSAATSGEGRGKTLKQNKHQGIYCFPPKGYFSGSTVVSEPRFLP